ncbi:MULTISPECIES: hypothetical protein [Mycobacteroides]|uniref:Uncharacterized protein n=1 Tax=Mycobacteroides franklinii TaxID=948102 RepID=A0A4R5PE02_9MYCO|nr:MULTISPECIES: hypothetical protein [Mycobacteroides]ORA55852.1 hypothetical protein BST24_25915 [Mycobacteroides franklinii]TDH23650.1 hypothetical protein EJ571_05105 [Mycobacteroides franklinii]SLB99674.1 Uncharacterised protein [Mycobacteroides abscessus subsp. abscessus]SLG10072.1 Uncharacterised protein [Mycobacteroides abscessus subsp. abscessus]
MKLLVIAGITVLGLLNAPVAATDPSGWCEWTPDLDMSQCGLVVGVPPSGQLIDGPGDWSTGETRTKN